MATDRNAGPPARARAGLWGFFCAIVCATLLAIPGPVLAGAGIYGIYDQAAKPLAGAPAFREHAGRVGLIVLFQPDCPWCLRQMDAARTLADDREDISVLAVGLRGRRMELIRELRRARTDLPAYIASPGLLDALGRPEATPRLYVVDELGRIVAWAAGYHDRGQLAHLIAAAKTAADERD